MSGGGKVIGRRRARGITQAAQARSGIRARKLGDTLDEAQRVALTAPGATPLRVSLFKRLAEGSLKFVLGGEFLSFAKKLGSFFEGVLRIGRREVKATVP